MAHEDPRARIEDRLAEIVDGTAPAELLATIAEDDALRDLCHDAEQAVRRARAAGDDYVPPLDLEARVLAALDRREHDAPQAATAVAAPAAPPPATLRAPLDLPATVDEPATPAGLAGSGPTESGAGAPAVGDELPHAASPAPLPADVDGAPAGAGHELIGGAAWSPAASAAADEVRPLPAPSPAATVPLPAPSPAATVPLPAPTPHRGNVVELVKRHRWWLLGGGGAATLGAAAAAALALFAVRGHLPTLGLGGTAWDGKVAQVTTAGGEGKLYVCQHDGSSCESVAEGARVPAGALVKTDGTVRAQLLLTDGTELSLDRDTHLALAERGRMARLERGSIVADVARKEDDPARIDVPVGAVKVLGTKFALRADAGSATVDVSRGKVRLEDPSERSVMVHAGEEGRLFRGQAPYAAATTLLGEALAWSDQIAADAEDDVAARGLGELRAQKPGDKSERKGAVTLATHRVKVRISGAVARTEVEEVFANSSSEVLEGIYRFPLPPDAKIERLALDVDGKLEEGAFVDRDRAAAIWRGSIVNAAPQLRQQMVDEIVWVPGPWRDPALLEWQRGSRFELRIYPLPARGSRRVVLAYTQVIRPSGGQRRYTYPLAHDPSGSTRVGNFEVDVQVRGHDASYGVGARGYALTQAKDGASDALRLTERDFVPSGDLVIEYALPNRDDELTAWAYEPEPSAAEPPAPVSPAPVPPPTDTTAFGAALPPRVDATYPYVALALRPKLPRVKEDEQRTYAFVVDASRSMYGESFKRATALTARMVRELDHEDRFTVLACDTSCQRFPGGLRAPDREASRAVRDWLGALQPEGASDPTAAIREARSAASDGSDRALRVVYVGDGTPTAGPIRPAYVSQAVAAALPSDRGSVTAVAVGVDSDLDTLAAMARGGGGVVLPYTPGQTTAEAAYAALGVTYGHALRDVRIELPSGLVEVAPEKVDTIPAGGESIVVARMTQRDLAGTVVLRGKLGRQDFEQRYPVKLVASQSKGNAFVPRLYAATRIADLERRTDATARQEAVELSSRFDVASRYTSLLVLESPAMFKAFGLDNTRNAPDWTGEEEATAQTATGALEQDADESTSEAEKKTKDAEDSTFGLGGLGLSGIGRASSTAGGGVARPSAAPASKSGPAAAPPPAPDAADPWNDWRPREEAPPTAWPGANEPARRESRADDLMPPEPPQVRGGWVPMRRVWDRQGEIVTGTVPRTATVARIAEAERAYATNPDRRGAVRELYVLYAQSGDLRRAAGLADHWSSKDPLDPEALTARADLAAERGERERAIRILGSVVDVRPDDVKAQKRLARLHRWAGRPALGCRHSVAISQLRQNDAELLAEAVRCSRETGESALAAEMLQAAAATTRQAAEQLLDARVDDTLLKGDLRLEATWTGVGHDLDLGLLHPEGHRISWLGAPTRSVITATDVTSTSREGLAVTGATAGDYVIEVVRGSGVGPVSGTVTVTVAGARRELPFTLDGERTAVGIARVTMQSRLERM